MGFDVTARVHYACLAMLELAKHHEQTRPVQLKKLAAAHEISPQFLVQILSRLKASGLIDSTRGASGGYRLTAAPTETSLGDIIRSVEGQPTSSDDPSQVPVARALESVFDELRTSVWQSLDRWSLADVIQRVPAGSEPMYYI